MKEPGIKPDKIAERESPDESINFIDEILRIRLAYKTVRVELSSAANALGRNQRQYGLRIVPLQLALLPFLNCPCSFPYVIDCIAELRQDPWVYDTGCVERKNSVSCCFRVFQGSGKHSGRYTQPVIY
jgi:hypothetical protein